MQMFLLILTKALNYHYRDLPRIFWSASSYLFWFSSTRLNQATYQKSSQGDGLPSKAEDQKRVKKNLKNTAQGAPDDLEANR